ncbi:MAG: class I SAM-dependent methyltransferase [Coleofasciculaceae cyanobacterium SM2_1_6]|nr:class I SAM-dependent methyltransferase [Coleofasciculaceae cyanobacterium SM2_1_6]
MKNSTDNTDNLEKIRQQFDQAPYPRTPLERSPDHDPYLLYTHSLATAHYLRHREVISTQDKLILDAGCGTGYTSLVLAAANPGAKVVGIDISPVSIDLAQKRAAFHGYENAVTERPALSGAERSRSVVTEQSRSVVTERSRSVEFQTLGIDELAQLGLTFDYINCDEVLYLLPDPQQALREMRSILNPQGIIRTNLHSYYQRQDFYQAQELFKLMGLQDQAPQQAEIEKVRGTMAGLVDRAYLKSQTWEPSYNQDDESVLCNFLLVGDKGFTIPETLTMLEAAGLELYSMVDWRQWQVLDLFKEPENLPIYLSFALASMSLNQQLEMYELLQPTHRLLDFWCGHAIETPEKTAVADWDTSDWQEVTVQLHPLLLTPEAKEEAIEQIQASKPFLISWHLPLTGEPYLLETKITSCLLPLWDGSQSFGNLLARWQTLYNLDPVTLSPTPPDAGLEVLIASLTELESLGYLLLSS